MRIESDCVEYGESPRGRRRRVLSQSTTNSYPHSENSPVDVVLPRPPATAPITRTETGM